MSEISKTLLKQAQDLRSSSPELIAINLLKQAGMSDEDARAAVAQDTMEKEATATLVGKGFDPEEAVKLVKAANVNVKELSNFSFVSSEETLADLLEKAANEIEMLEADVAEAKNESQLLKAAAEEPAKVIPDAITKLATAGSFTNEDLDALLSVPIETLTKVAAAVEEPWGLGKAAGVARPVTDPFLEFLLN